MHNAPIPFPPEAVPRQMAEAEAYPRTAGDANAVSGRDFGRIRGLTHKKWGL
jgi:hypothetical protein